ncbi:MAG: hypothetical protein NTZ94_16680 [Verrucomicrobia bacterium]|nr:hypothetical protein [Verrucomicrobiota bacterium]
MISTEGPPPAGVFVMGKFTEPNVAPLPIDTCTESLHPSADTPRLLTEIPDAGDSTATSLSEQAKSEVSVIVTAALLPRSIRLGSALKTGAAAFARREALKKRQHWRNN